MKSASFILHLSVVSVISLVIESSLQAMTCNQVHDQGLQVLSSPAGRESSIRIPISSIYKLPRLAEQFGLAHMSRDPYKNIEKLFKKLAQGVTADNCLSRADEMARFGDEMLAFFPHLDRSEKKKIEYTLVEAVNKLESFGANEMKHEPAKSVFVRFPRFSYFEMNQFSSVTRNYLVRSPLYKTYGSHTGVIDWSDIRDIFSQQKWIVEIKDHDTYHLHYSSGHPYYLPSVFRAAWSRNPYRYYLVSSLFEGVDTFQTSLERRIFNFMSSKSEFTVQGKFDLEGAIIYLARAPLHDLMVIARKMSLTEQDGYIGQFRAWRPNVYENYAKSQSSRDQELNGYIQSIQNLLNDPSENIWMTTYTHNSLKLY